MIKSKKETKVEDTKGRKQYLARYVAPHRKISRPVLETDMGRLAEEAHVLYNLCHTGIGVYQGGEAVAHQQIDDKDPLRFFVTKDKKIMINPVIVRHTRHTVDSVEGCLTFHEEAPIKVQRYNKITAEYYTMNSDGGIGKKITEELGGFQAKVFQHEVDHLDCKYIFEF